jgi:hypothetical protein
VADHPRHAHAGVRLAAGVVIVTVLPGRVGHDRAARDRIPGHSLRLERRGAGDDHDGVDVGGVAHRPLERLHAAERASGHRGEAANPERIEEGALGADHVGDGDHREVGAEGTAALRIDR